MSSRVWGALGLGVALLAACRGGAPAAESDPMGAAASAQAPACGITSVVINEVATRGGSPGDWVELYNAGSVAVDLAGFRLKDGDDSHPFYVLPGGTQLAAGGFLVLEQAAFRFGLGGDDAVRLYAPRGEVPVASYAWKEHATTTHGRCADGHGSFAVTRAATKGLPNDCPPTAAPLAQAATEPGQDLSDPTTATWSPRMPQR